MPERGEIPNRIKDRSPARLRNLQLGQNPDVLMVCVRDFAVSISLFRKVTTWPSLPGESQFRPVGLA